MTLNTDIAARALITMLKVGLEDNGPMRSQDVYTRAGVPPSTLERYSVDSILLRNLYDS